MLLPRTPCQISVMYHCYVKVSNFGALSTTVLSAFRSLSVVTKQLVSYYCSFVEGSSDSLLYDVIKKNEDHEQNIPFVKLNNCPHNNYIKSDMIRLVMRVKVKKTSLSHACRGSVCSQEE